MLKPSASTPRNPAKLEFLDGLRAMSVAMVFVYHAVGVAFGGTQMEWEGNWRDPNSVTRSFFLVFPLWFGYIGVAFFFVISGFCIHLSDLRKHTSWLNFARRRFLRIYPAYVVALLLAIGIFLVTHSHIPITLENVLLHLCLLHNLNASAIYSLNPSFWSIATEVQLYMLYPLLVILSRKIAWRNTLKCCVALEIVLAIYKGFVNPDCPLWLAESPFVYVGSWALGANLANAYVDGSVPRYRAVLFLPLLLFALAAYFYKPLFYLQFLANSTMFAMLVSNMINEHGFGGSKAVLAGLQFRWLVNLGVMSFSFYLLHQPLLELVGHFLTQFAVELHPFLRLSIALAMSLPIYWFCHGFYKLIELPCLHAKNLKFKFAS